MYLISLGEKTYRDIYDHPGKKPAELPSDDGDNRGFNDLAGRVFRERFDENLCDLVHA